MDNELKQKIEQHLIHHYGASKVEFNENELTIYGVNEKFSILAVESFLLNTHSIVLSYKDTEYNIYSFKIYEKSV